MAVEMDRPLWENPLSEDLADASQVEHHRTEHLTMDPRPMEENNRALLDPMVRQTSRFWIFFVILGGLLMIELSTWTYQMIQGLGITGLTRPTMWALYIVNFVYFIGIGHAGTFISAALRVLKIEFRRPISRAAEILTIFALSTAATFPIIHLGRSWKFYWLLPYPNVRQLWPSYHSPLLWDLTAILTYLSCSILFAYIGLIPDIAMARDHSKGWRYKLYRALALGWRGTEQEWHNHETAANVFSYAIIPVMFSVHTIVSWDFAMALQTGWHSTVFGPYFVVGALFSGAAAVIIVLALLQKFMHLNYFLRPEHFDGMGKFLLLLSFTWAYFYFNDYLAPWYGGAPADKALSNLLQRGSGAPFWYLMLFCNILVPWATLWNKKIRRSVGALFFISVLVNVGMYLERVIIIPIGLGINELPFDWGQYRLQLPETLITIGAFSLVGFLYVLFTRFFPVIPMWEVYEGQILQGVRRIGKALVPSRSDPE
jgi:molybdopterin-containing oxidoreductase family membrane subunit